MTSDAKPQTGKRCPFCQRPMRPIGLSGSTSFDWIERPPEGWFSRYKDIAIDPIRWACSSCGIDSLTENGREVLEYQARYLRRRPRWEAWLAAHPSLPKGAANAIFRALGSFLLSGDDPDTWTDQELLALPFFGAVSLRAFRAAQRSAENRSEK